MKARSRTWEEGMVPAKVCPPEIEEPLGGQVFPMPRYRKGNKVLQVPFLFSVVYFSREPCPKKEETVKVGT